MAPFLSHLVIGERVWAALDGRRPAGNDYGVFLFGCLAPDVDKVCPGLEQGTTHFLPKDRESAPLRRHTHYFLDHQTDFLRAPFPNLEPHEQSFVLGYLCHVATDEVTGRLGRTLRDRLAAAGKPLPNVVALLTAIDPQLWTRAADPDGALTALAAVTIPAHTWVFAPHDCLVAMHRIVLPQVREGGGLEPYVRMMRRHWQWLHHGWVSDASDDPVLEDALADHRRSIERDLPLAERLVKEIEMDDLVGQAVQHSIRCIQTLLQSAWSPG